MTTDDVPLPQRTKVVHYGPGAMLSRPAAAAHLAAVSNAWAGIEAALAMFVEYGLAPNARPTSVVIFSG